MEDDLARMEQAIERLTDAQRDLVLRCLRAIVNGSYIESDDEFSIVMGVTRDEAAQTLEAWPLPAAHGWNFVAVNNTLNNLLGYPHGDWQRLSDELGVSEREVAQALMAWRDEDRRDGGGKAYFDALM